MVADAEGTPWGMCAAFGCPLFASMGEEGKWFCPCHVRQQHGLNDAITACLRRNMWLVRATRDIRRFASTPDWTSVLGGIEMILRDQKRLELMFGEADSSPHRPGRPIVNAWLQRLEGVLVDLTQDVGTTAPIPTHGAPVTGPTHATPAYTEIDA